MRKITITCDICGKECSNVDFSVFSGAIRKMNEKGELGRMIFEGHYCEDDTPKILEHVSGLKNEAKSSK